jgi:hypothetical protein
MCVSLCMSTGGICVSVNMLVYLCWTITCLLLSADAITFLITVYVMIFLISVCGSPEHRTSEPQTSQDRAFASKKDVSVDQG